MPLKTVEIEDKTYAEIEDGKPIYVNEDGEETAYDAEELAAKLTQANGEITTRRDELKEANDKIATFDGIEDPAAALAALKTVKNLEDKQLVDAGEVEKVKSAAVAAVEERHATIIKERYEPLEAERDDYRDRLHREMLGGRFARSKFIDEKMSIPVQMVQATFSNHFTIENGEVVARDTAGNQVFSKQNPGEIADFDEALQLIVEASPYREQILKRPAKHPLGPGKVKDAAKTMSRKDADKLAQEDPPEMARRMADGWQVVDPPPEQNAA